MENKDEQKEILADTEKIGKFAKDITTPVIDAATKPDGYLDVALFFCGLSFFLDKAINVCCKNNMAQRKVLVDWFCGALRKDYDKE